MYHSVVKVKVSFAWSCPTPCNAMDYIACQAPLSMGFSRQEYRSGLPFPSPGDLPHTGTEPGSSPLQADSLLSEPLGKPVTVLGQVSLVGSLCLTQGASPAAPGALEPCLPGPKALLSSDYFTSSQRQANIFNRQGEASARGKQKLMQVRKAGEKSFKNIKQKHVV